MRSADMTRIAAIRSALPPYRYQQAELTGAMAELSNVGPPQRALLERLHANAGVDTRHTVLPLAEYKGLDGFGPTNDLYIEHATDLGERALDSALRAAGVAAQRSGPAHRHVGHRPGGAVAGCPPDPAAGTAAGYQAGPYLRARLRGRRGGPGPAARLPARLAGAHRRAAGGRAVLADRAAAGATTADLVVSGLFGDGAVAVVARGEQAGAGCRRTAGR